MTIYRHEFEECMAEANLTVNPLPEEEVLRRWANLERYARPGLRVLWERFKKARSRQDPEGWQRVTGLPGPVILLFGGRDKPWGGYRFRTSKELELALRETWHFEFYVTDPQERYLVAYNHHDFLIWTGDVPPEAVREFRKAGIPSSKDDAL